MNTINFSSSDSDYFLYPRYTISEGIAKDLGLDLGIFNISTGRASEEEAFQLSILDWCQKRWGSQEYHLRIEAAKQMLECYFSEESELEIEYWNLASLPENFSFPKLKRLYLDRNNLTSLPKKFHCPMLESLSLCGNPLGSFPEKLNNHPNLEFIELIDCNLKSMPENLRLEKLKSLNLGRNWLTTLPEDLDFPELREFNLEENELTSLPENFNFSKLIDLDVSSNKDMQELPTSLYDCAHLKFLLTWETEIPEEMVESILNGRKELRYGRNPDEEEAAVPPDDMRTSPEVTGEIGFSLLYDGKLSQSSTRPNPSADEGECEIMENADT